MNFMSGLGDSLNSGVESAKTRVATAQAGKKMLDEGGPTKEAEIYALNAMRAARSEDDKLTKQLNDEVKSYEEAVKSIKKALATSGGTPLTPEEKEKAEQAERLGAAVNDGEFNFGRPVIIEQLDLSPIRTKGTVHTDVQHATTNSRNIATDQTKC